MQRAKDIVSSVVVLLSTLLVSNAHASNDIPLSTKLPIVPLSFEANVGQVSQEVRYLARGKDYQLFFTDNEAVFSLLGSGSKNNSVIRMRIKDGLDSSPIAETEVAHKSNYLLTRNSDSWRTDINHFKRVRYPNVYPGIDLVYYGSDTRKLEYDFIVRPGQDPSRIKVHFDGVTALNIDDAGNLLLHTDNGTLHQKAPVLYQYKDGKREFVKGNYHVDSTDTVSFHVGSYDESRTLVIDPVVEWTTYFGTSDDTAEYIVVTSDAIYVTGHTSSLFFPRTGMLQPVNAGGQDAFVTKLPLDVSSFLYSTYLGGSGDESNGGSIGSTMAVDGVGNIYLTGRTTSGDFPVTSGVYQSNLRGENDFYVTKIDRDGNSLAYSTLLGGDDFDRADVESGPTLAVDADGNAIILGYTSANLFPLVNPIQSTVLGGLDGLLAKLDSRGSSLIFSTFIGGTRDDKPRAVTVDTEGNIYITGRTDSRDFPSTVRSRHGGQGDAFVTKFPPDGSAITFSRFIGGSQTDKGRAIALDERNNVYVTGNTQSTNFPVVGALQSTLAGGGDTFVTRLSGDGRRILFSTYYGGTGDDLGADIKVSSRGNVYVCGYTQSTDYPVTADALESTSGGGQDGYITWFTIGRASSVVYSSYLGGLGDETAKSLGVSGSSMYIMLNTTSTDIPIFNALQGIPTATYITSISTN